MTIVPIAGTEHPVLRAGARRTACPPDDVQRVVVHLRGRPYPPSLEAIDRGARASGDGPVLVDPADAAPVRHHLEASGLRVVDVSHDGRSISAEGDVRSLNRAFGVELATYDTTKGVVRGHDGPVRIPQELADTVVAVSGLNNVPLARPHCRHAGPDAVGAVPDVPSGSTSYPVSQIADAYAFPAGLDGEGEEIAIVELGGGFQASDMDAFFAEQGVPTPSITTVDVEGGTHGFGKDHGNDSEVALDIQIAGAVAPKARFVVYFVPNYDYAFALALKAILSDPKNSPSVISISWGGGEGSYAAQARTMTEELFREAGARGITVICSAGDHGGDDGTSEPTVEFPAACPSVLSCGGTTIRLDGERIVSETVWNNLQSSWGGASGGGVSAVFDVPHYQAASGVPKTASGHVGRGVPDVAAAADPLTGYRYYLDGKWSFVGGTSAAVPLWAGLVARLNQGLGRPLGFLNASLYRSVAAGHTLNDVTQGGNGPYTAGKGWDPCTGLGTPRGADLLTWFRKQSA